jgi:hypothetical protein
MTASRKTIPIIAALFLNMSAWSQGHVTHSRQEWLQLNLLFGREDATGFRFDMSTRHLEGHPGMSQYLLRGGLTYLLPFGISAVTGLGRIRYYDDGEHDRNEWRPYQDLTRSVTLGKSLFQQRLRTEARFLRYIPDPMDAGDRHFELRLRYRLQWQWPLATLSVTHPERRLMLTVGEELMVNPVHGPANRFFSTNRILLSPTVRWNEALDIAVVFNHQYSARGTVRDFESAEVFWLNITRRIIREARKTPQRG